MLSAGAIYYVTGNIFSPTEVFTVGSLNFNSGNLFNCALGGLAITGLIVWITEYYTSTAYRPVRSIAQASTTGHAQTLFRA